MFAAQSSTLTNQLDAKTTVVTSMTIRLNKMEQFPQHKQPLQSLQSQQPQQIKAGLVTANQQSSVACAPQPSPTIGVSTRSTSSVFRQLEPENAVLDPTISCALLQNLSPGVLRALEQSLQVRTLFPLPSIEQSMAALVASCRRRCHRRCRHTFRRPWRRPCRHPCSGPCSHLSSYLRQHRFSRCR